MSTPIEKVRAACLQRGDYGILMIGRTFRSFDENGSNTLDRDDLKNGLDEYGVKLSAGEFNQLFSSFDRDGTGSVGFDEFLLQLRPPMSATRVALINKAFVKMDVNNEGAITIDDLRKLYDASRHPKVTSGEWTADQVYQEFMTNFQGGNVDNQVTKEEWLNYYAGVSASIDDDEYFTYMMNQCWHF